MLNTPPLVLYGIIHKCSNHSSPSSCMWLYMHTHSVVFVGLATLLFLWLPYTLLLLLLTVVKEAITFQAPTVGYTIPSCLRCLLCSSEAHECIIPYSTIIISSRGVLTGLYPHCCNGTIYKCGIWVWPLGQVAIIPVYSSKSVLGRVRSRVLYVSIALMQWDGGITARLLVDTRQILYKYIILWNLNCVATSLWIILQGSPLVG